MNNNIFEQDYKIMKKLFQRINNLSDNNEEEILNFIENNINKIQLPEYKFADMLYCDKNYFALKNRDNIIIKINTLIKYIENNLETDKTNKNQVKIFLHIIRIEFMRFDALIEESDDVYSQAKDNFDKINKKYKNIASSINKINTKYKSMDKSINDIDAKYKNIGDSVNNITTQIMTIISIFTAIIITFFGGISFIQSTFSILDKVSLNKLLIIVGIESMVLFNTLYLLFSFMSKLTVKNDNKIKHTYSCEACKKYINGTCENNKNCFRKFRQYNQLCYNINLFLILLVGVCITIHIFIYLKINTYL